MTPEPQTPAAPESTPAASADAPAGEHAPKGEAAPETPQSAPGAAAFTQADVDRIVGEARSKAKAQHEKELAAFKATADLSELERYKLEAEQATQARDTVLGSAQQAVLKAEVKAAAAAAGVKPELLPYVLRLVDTSAVELTELDADQTAVAAAVAKVVEDMPALVTQGGGAPAKSGSDFQEPGTPTFTKAQIEAMSIEEYNANSDAIMAALKAGAIR